MRQENAYLKIMSAHMLRCIQHENHIKCQCPAWGALISLKLMHMHDTRTNTTYITSLYILLFPRVITVSFTANKKVLRDARIFKTGDSQDLNDGQACQIQGSSVTDMCLYFTLRG